MNQGNYDSFQLNHINHFKDFDNVQIGVFGSHEDEGSRDAVELVIDGLRGGFLVFIIKLYIVFDLIYLLVDDELLGLDEEDAVG